MKIMQLSILMNNLGASLLDSGRDIEAFEMFQGAIQVMMYSSKGDRSLPAYDKRIIRAQSILAKYEQNPQHLQHISALERDEVIFSQAIRMPDGIFDRNPGLGQLQSAIILFNTALTLQLQPADRGFARADSLYRMSYDLAIIVQPLPFEVSEVTMLLLMGLLNNMSKLNNDLGNFDLARRLCQTLSNFISAMPVSTHATLGSQRKRLLFNSLLLTPPMAAGAA